jgi:Na+-driven multidrug efflux pump
MKSREHIFEASPWRAIAELSIPSLVSIVVMMLYNMADLFFVAWSDDLNQVAAVSLAMPAFTFLMAISTMIGNGGCTKIAQAMGQQDPETIRRYSALCTPSCAPSI